MDDDHPGQDCCLLLKCECCYRVVSWSGACLWAARRNCLPE